MRVINGQYFPLVVFLDIANRVQELLRVGEVANARIVVHVLERIDLQCASILAADQAAGFIRRIGACLRDELFELSCCEDHC